MGVFTDAIKMYYKEGLYTKDDLKLFVEVDYITAEVYKELTGEDYIA